jgi:quercetin dioxygenase-like cupin family protein
MIQHNGSLIAQQDGKQFYIAKSTGQTWRFKTGGTVYGISTENCFVYPDDKEYYINANTVFSFACNELSVDTASSLFKADLTLFFAEGFYGQTVLGVPLEEKGRLKYIDGCTDSLLVYAPRLGDPCLNHLHFPAGIDQTFHTHPSIRMGYVARGNGVASFPTGDVALTTGDIFMLPVDTLHRFRTPNESMDIIAFHPETDTGPTDEDHPMLNRTIIPK